jgi:prophage antirepressor-like protein
VNNVLPFAYKGYEVRTTMGSDGEPRFVGIDVCAVLGHPNSRQVLSRLEDDEKGVQTVDTLGGPQEVVVVTEPGLYSLILTSRRPEAAEFKRWITHDVIPAIRKTGSYADPQRSKFGAVMSELGEIKKLCSVLPGVAEAANDIRGDIKEIKRRNSRINISDTVKIAHRRILDAMMGRCPCCWQTKASNEFEFDHFFTNQRADFTSTWPICIECHKKLTFGELSRSDVDRAFQAYHEFARRRLPKQQELFDE